MSKKLYTLTDDHRSQLKPWADKWIANAMSTKPMHETDRRICRKAVAELYQAAGKPVPSRIVFVPSPFVGRFAAGYAAAIWWMRKNPKSPLATRDATYVATDDATSDATDAATRDATDAATSAATDAATRDATSAATDAATRDATRAATSAATSAATRAATDAATRDATRAATRDATDDATDVATRDATRAATRDATDDATDVATRDATDDATDVATRDATRAATRDATDDATDVATRDATDDATDDATSDDLKHWFYIPGLTQIQSFGISLADNLFALKCAQNAWRFYQGGNAWSAWSSYLSFFRHVAKLPINWDKWDCWEKLSEHSGYRFVHDEFCIICDRPEILMVDAQNRPHNDNGPFCRWRDGSALYSVHGVRVPAFVIEKPETITVSIIEKEENSEVRRVMMEKYGLARFLHDSGAKEIHRDDYGTLYRKDIPNDEPLVMVSVINSTAEPDGSFRNYTLRVPPTIKTAREACAWTFGKSEKEYLLEVET